MAVGITFVSLRAIIKDLMNVIRGAQISQSEPISDRQLESWVHQYRAFLLKQDMDKGKMPNPDYIQEIAGLELSPVDEVAEITDIDRGLYYLRSDLQLPKTIDLNHKPGIMFVGTADGHELLFTSETRNKWQRFKKYTGRDALVFLRNRYLYVTGEDNLKYLTVRGIFEIPTEVSNFVNPTTGTTSAGMDDIYPIPMNMVPVLKGMILKQELNIEAQAWSDDKNDSDARLEPNVNAPTAQQEQG